MVLTSEPTLRESVATPLRDVMFAPKSVFQIDAGVEMESTTQTYQLDIEIRSATSLSNIGLTRVEALSLNGERAEGEIYIFMQLLDGQGRASSHPASLVVQTPQTAPQGGKVTIPLAKGQKVRLLLFVKNGPCPSTVRISGFLITHGNASLLNGSHAVEKYVRGLHGAMDFVPEIGRNSPKVTRQKRSRSEARHAEENRRIPRRESESDSEPPQLMYAQVAGGDDES